MFLFGFYLLPSFSLVTLDRLRNLGIMIGPLSYLFTGVLLRWKIFRYPRLEKKVFIKSLTKHFKNSFMIHNFSLFYCFSFILCNSSLFTKPSLPLVCIVTLTWHRYPKKAGRFPPSRTGISCLCPIKLHILTYSL